MANSMPSLTTAEKDKGKAVSDAVPRTDLKGCELV
jgi:hypothetical protein